MSTEFRGHYRTQPFTAEELENLRTQIFPSLPGYKPEDESILVSGIAEMCHQMKWERTSEQIQIYSDWFEQNFGGRVAFSVVVASLENLHDVGGRARATLSNCDQDKDGFIQKGEFELFLKSFVTDYPEVAGVSYDVFVKEADANADGKVSIEEAVVWLEKRVADAN